MKTNCSKCGQVIKEIITISGKPFGTTCAERELGHKLPNNFTGDYDKHIEKIQKTQEDLRERRRLDEMRVSELWEDMKVLTSKWDQTNDWGRNILLSFENQLGYQGLLNCIRIKNYPNPQSYISSDHVKKHGLCLVSHTRLISSLSEKQISLINRL